MISCCTFLHLNTNKQSFPSNKQVFAVAFRRFCCCCCCFFGSENWESWENSQRAGSGNYTFQFSIGKQAEFSIPVSKYLCG